MNGASPRRGAEVAAVGEAAVALGADRVDRQVRDHLEAVVGRGVVDHRHAHARDGADSGSTQPRSVRALR